jgi:hypothetical protein
LSKVFVVDTNKQALNPVHPGRARIFLSQGKAAVFKRYPFTIILTCTVEQTAREPLRIKLDPLLITANGHGSRQMCLMDKRGFPRTGPKQAKRVKGFQTGDIVRAVGTYGTKIGTPASSPCLEAQGYPQAEAR